MFSDYIWSLKMEKNFDKCLEIILQNEGGYVWHERDPGGETNFGITRGTYEQWVGREVLDGEMKRLTKADVAPIYEKNYWLRAQCDKLASGLDLAVFDWQVNSGSRSSKALQGLVKAKKDGVIGPMTLAEVDRHDPRELIQGMHDVRQNFYEGLRTFETFGRGWTYRNKHTLELALQMAD